MKTEPAASGKFLTFIHRFSNSVQCTVRVPEQPPASGSHLDLSFELVGRLKPKHVSAYRRWMLGVNQTLSDHWRISLLYALGPAYNLTELWMFKPGEAPRLLERLNIGIP